MALAFNRAAKSFWIFVLAASFSVRADEPQQPKAKASAGAAAIEKKIAELENELARLRKDLRKLRKEGAETKVLFVPVRNLDLKELAKLLRIACRDWPGFKVTQFANLGGLVLEGDSEALEEAQRFISYVSVCGPSAKYAAEQALAKFVGTWEFTDGQEKMGIARRIVFKSDLTCEKLDAAGKTVEQGTFRLEPTAGVDIFDYRSNEQKKKGEDNLGIYQFSPRRTIISFTTGRWEAGKWLGKPRPTNFDRNNGATQIELKRARDPR